jgi:hypothetical protein
VETIDDHYAALQAWNEWSRNQQRTTAPPQGDAGMPQDPVADSQDTLGAAARAGAQGPGQPSVWVEGEQGFAPYGQLFSRLRQSHDLNESG